MPKARDVRRAVLCLAMLSPLAVAGVAQGVEPAPVTECDTLAQPPKESMGPIPMVAPGVAIGSMRWPAARAACAKAMTDFPGEVRFVAYAARAADKAGDAREAARLNKAAADEGNAVAQNNLGVMYVNGEGGLGRSGREAERYYRMAAEQGYPGAQVNLGVMLAQGLGGVPRNDREAVRLFQAAANSGNVDGQNSLGKMYAEGRGGLPRDLGQAVSLWRSAADGGSVEARGNLRKAGR